MKHRVLLMLAMAIPVSAGVTAELATDLPAACPVASTRTTIDIDGDDIPDRIYTADTQARIWRSDGAAGPPRLFADLGSAAGTRQFLAAPDVSLFTDAQGHSRLRIAIGSAGRGANRFYVLQDDLRESPLPVIHEQDLLAWPQPADTPRALPAGHYLDLGDAQVLSPSLTTAGRITFAAARQPPDAACRADIGIDTLDPRTGRRIRGTDPLAADEWALTLSQRPARQPLEAGFNAQTGQIECHFDREPVPACAAAVPVRRTFWRREDAD